MIALQTNAIPGDLLDSAVGWGEVIGAAVFVVVGLIVAGIVRRTIRRALARLPGLQPYVVSLTARSAGWAIVVIGAVGALSLLGVDTGPILLVLLLVAGVAVLSGRELLENVGAGVIIQARSPFRIGDQVEHSGLIGTVVDVNARTVIVETVDGKQVHLPNAQVLRDPIINLTALGALRTTIDLLVEYGTNLDEAIAIITAAASSVDGVLDDPAPEAYATGFGDSGVQMLVRFWHAPDNRTGYEVADRVVRAVDGALRRGDVVVAFPHMVIQRGDPSDGGG